jgi:nucleoside-diphosphate-sugar epimerase
MKILVSGSSGFIGKAVVDVLSRTNSEIRLISRTKDGRDFPNARHLSVDLSQSFSLRQVLGNWQPEVLLHLAWEGIPDFSVDRCLKNLTMSVQLCEQALGLGCKKIVLAGSCWEFGNVSGEVTEDTKSVAPSVFASTKSAVFSIIQSMASTFEAQAICGRIFYAYGAHQKAQSLIPSVVMALKSGHPPQLKNPNVALDFLDVRDTASAFAMLCLSSSSKSEIYNICSGQSTAVKLIVNEIAKLLGAKPIYDETTTTSEFWGNNQKLKSLGWNSKIDINTGLKDYLDWIANPR